MDLNIAILSESSTPETTPATPSTAVHTPNILNDRSTISTAATTPTFQNSVSGNGNSVSKSSKSLANVPRILPISSNNCRKDCEATPASDSFVPSLATVLTHLVSLSPAERGQVGYEKSYNGILHLNSFIWRCACNRLIFYSMNSFIRLHVFMP